MGSTEPKANLYKGNNGPTRVQREGGLWHQWSTSHNTNSSGRRAFVRAAELLFILFLFWQLWHNAGVGPALTGLRVCPVCCEDVSRLQEREVAKWRMIVPPER